MADEHDLFIRREIDKIYTTHPEFGYRRIAVWLKKYNNMTINKKAVLRHMREMGIQAIYPRKNASKAEPGHIIYPYLLKELVIGRPSQVWRIDITYVLIHKSWLYLAAIIDWHSRFVVSWEIDDNLEIRFVLNAYKNALKQAYPEIMNGDQGSHFTSFKYTNLFIEAGSRKVLNIILLLKYILKVRIFLLPSNKIILSDKYYVKDAAHHLKMASP